MPLRGLDVVVVELLFLQGGTVGVNDDVAQDLPDLEEQWLEHADGDAEAVVDGVAVLERDLDELGGDLAGFVGLQQLLQLFALEVVLTQVLLQVVLDFTHSVWRVDIVFLGIKVFV